ncbi:MAG: hypothetical protein GF311_22950 [Candidatus Lokiarchaeota archaeon]|nr:hypothetical protein [Candidatus Lokiarchaeota archaeon]
MEMNQRLKNILIHGTLNLILYIITPLIFILILTNFQYFEFNPIFLQAIFIFGMIGVSVSILKNSFSENSNTHHIIGISSTLFSGVYLFFIFGGFSFGLPFGNYSIQTNTFQAELSLQIVAWPLLIASIIRLISSTIKYYEKIKNKSLTIKLKKKISSHKLILWVGYIIYIIISVYLIITAVNGTQISFVVHEDYNIGYDNKNTPELSDDTINISIHFDVINGGIFPILNTEINIEIYTINTTDLTQLSLPNNTKIGESKNNFFEIFAGNNVTKNQTIIVDIFNEWVPGLILFDANLDIRFSLNTYYAGIIIDYRTAEFVYWDAGDL